MCMCVVLRYVGTHTGETSGNVAPTYVKAKMVRKGRTFSMAKRREEVWAKLGRDYNCPK